MAVLLSSWLIVAVFTLCSCGQFGQAAVQFNFSRSTVTVSENGNLPSELSIIKTGENVMDISFRVIVNPGTAQETTDYVANDNDPYVFTSTTRQLPIRTTLMTDRAGESVEQFTICLPDQTVLSLMGAEAVEPTCATINIIDDDSVVIGFANTSLDFMEAGGPAQKVCVEVKALGLGLDPFDRVPLNINANDSQVQLSGNSLLFDMGITIRCVTVSVVDNNNIADGDRSVSLTITSGGSSSVPVELYPNTILVDIVDDDRVTFTFVPQRSFTVLEGDTFDSLEIQKSGATTLTFRVTLRVELITKSGSSTDSNNLVVNPMTLLFNPSTTQMPFEIQIPDNSLSEMQKQFNITMDRIETTNEVGALVTSGEPITIIVYDNDYEVGFTEERISIPEGSGEEVCVEILSPAEVHPSVNIGVSFTVVNLTFTEGNLELGTNMVVLSATNLSECIVVKFPINNQQCDIDKREYALQLSSITDTNSRYSVNIRQENITISIGDSQDCLRQSNVAGIVAGVVVSIFVVIIIIVVVFIVIYLVWLKKCISSVPEPGVEYEATNNQVLLSENSPGYEYKDDRVDPQSKTHIPTEMPSTNWLGVRPEQREDHKNNSLDSTELITRDNSSIINNINDYEGRRNGGHTNDSEGAKRSSDGGHTNDSDGTKRNSDGGHTNDSDGTKRNSDGGHTNDSDGTKRNSDGGHTNDSDGTKRNSDGGHTNDSDGTKRNSDGGHTNDSEGAKRNSDGGHTNDSEGTKRNSDGGHTNDSDGTKRSSDGSHTNDSDGTKRSSNGGHTDDSEGDRRSSDGGHIDDSEGTKQSSDINEGRQQSSDGSFTTEGREQSNNRGDTDQGATPSRNSVHINEGRKQSSDHGDTDQGAELNNDCDTQKVV